MVFFSQAAYYNPNNAPFWVIWTLMILAKEEFNDPTDSLFFFNETHMNY